MLSCKHSDCINFQNVDVTKGNCLLDEQFVIFNAEACPRFSWKPKCKNCNKYKRGMEKGLGICMALDDGEHWISGEIIATTCEKYEESAHE